MPRVEQTVDISASPETVWFFLSDPTYTPKLVPDMISNEAEPAGPAVEGQKTRGILKVAGRKMKVFTEVTEVVQSRKLVQNQRPGGMFKSLSFTFTLDPTNEGTRATQTLDYEVSMGYFGKVLNSLVVNRVVNKNARAYLTNLKKTAELKAKPK